MRNLSSLAAISLVMLFVQSADASTAAFAGTVVKVEPCPANDKNCLARFTVRISYFDYISWGKFGRDSKTGETITRKVMPLGTVCMINGRLINNQSFAEAIQAGAWGYFYEDTWLDLHTTPDFQWGQVIAHDGAGRRFDLRVHQTHKEIRLASNPPRVEKIKYTGDTAFRIEEKETNAGIALVENQWVQIHEARPQLILVRSASSMYDPKQWQPQQEGRRGYANDLSAPAVLNGYDSKQKDKVIDLSTQLTVSRLLKGKWEDVTINCKKTSFVLDGKLCPVDIAVRAGRRAVLGHYRKDAYPHKVFVSSIDHAVRGVIKSVGADGVIEVESKDDKQVRKVKLDDTALYFMDGLASDREKVLRQGDQITVHPRRGRTIIAFPSN